MQGDRQAVRGADGGELGPNLWPLRYGKSCFQSHTLLGYENHKAFGHLDTPLNYVRALRQVSELHHSGALPHLCPWARLYPMSP